MPTLVTSSSDLAPGSGEAPTLLERMVRGFFDNGGRRAYVAATITALDGIDEIALLCPHPDDNEEAITQCERRRDRVAVLSLPRGLGGVEEVLAARPLEASSFAAAHHPWVWVGGELTPPGGHVAGAYVKRDPAWTPPTSEDLRGLDDPPLEQLLSERESSALADGRVNPLRDLRAQGRGIRVFGSRPLAADPAFPYVQVRRYLVFLEASIDRGLAWVVFEPSGEALWASVRDAVVAFLTAQWTAGALLGRTPDEAFFVRCDRTTMTQEDLDAGRLICLVGVAPVRPAEFVIFRIGRFTAGCGD